MKFKVVIADDRYSDYEAEQKVLAPHGAAVTVVRDPGAGAIMAAAADADGLLVNLPPLTAEMIAGLEKCRVISRYGVGYDNVDVAAATARGIWVANVTDYCAEDVSDQAMALFLACVRRVARRDRLVKSGNWDMKAAGPQYRVCGKTFVLCGYGAIARVMHRKLGGFAPGRVLVYDPYVPAADIRAAGAQPADWETALAEGDFFSIHMPVTPETRGMFNEAAFRRMKPTAIIVNTARGPIIDEEALYRALSENWIAGAGLDVFNQEPVNPDNPLLTLDNITVSGHVGFYTEESLLELKTKAAGNVAAVLTGGRPAYPVNKISAG